MQKYKGDTIPEAVLTVAHLTPYGRKFVAAKAAEEAKNLAPEDGSTDGSPVADKKTSLKKKMLAVGKKDIGFSNVVKAVIPPQPKPAPLPPQRPQRHIPYVVTRPGALVHERPEKGSRRVSKLTNNSKVYVNTKKADRTKRDFYWFRTQDGWVPATTEGGQRIIQPTMDSTSPVAIIITSTSFADPPPPGFWESIFFFLSNGLVRRHINFKSQT